jgi:hypothetical protein
MCTWMTPGAALSTMLETPGWQEHIQWIYSTASGGLITGGACLLLLLWLYHKATNH